MQPARPRAFSWAEGHRFPRTYQLSDVLGDTDIVQETVDDLQFQERLRRLAKNHVPAKAIR